MTRRPLHDDSPRVTLLTLALIVLAVAAVATLGGPEPAEAKAGRWLGPVIATFYGPGFYGHRTACGQTLTLRLRGVAHRTLPCGTRLTIRKGRRRVHVRVVDRGPYSGATFDLTARTAMDLCGCKRPFTMRVHWRRGRH